MCIVKVLDSQEAVMFQQCLNQLAHFPVYKFTSREDFVGLLALQGRNANSYKVKEYTELIFRPEEREGSQALLANQIGRLQSL